MHLAAEQGHTPSAVEVVFKPPTSSESALHVYRLWNVHLCTSSGTRKVVLQYRAGSKDGLGLLLSGGLAPVTVTRVKPGGQAELAGIGIGDTILEVDGINCRKKLEASQFAALKALVQRSSPAGDRAAERDLEVSKTATAMGYTEYSYYNLNLVNVVIKVKCVV